MSGLRECGFARVCQNGRNCSVILTLHVIEDGRASKFINAEKLCGKELAFSNRSLIENDSVFAPFRFSAARYDKQRYEK